jgi:crotonobetainyl-CoA:carnitine CoA-transferase CaiB-like acyl-CoA transferase
LSAGLAGVRVVDFGNYVAGPLAALLLGASVAASPIASIDDGAAFLAECEIGLLGARRPTRHVPRTGLGGWLSGTPPVVGPNPAPIGSQAVDVLTGLGLALNEMEPLFTDRVVASPNDLPGSPYTPERTTPRASLE